MKKIVYIGNSFSMVRILCSSDIFKIGTILCEVSKCNWNFDEPIFNGIEIFNIKEAEDIYSVIGNRKVNAIMYDFGVIIPKEIVSQCNVCNFHPGDLRTNRGSSPINWSILLGDTETKMSLYQITEKIDLGKLISEKIIKIDADDTPKKLRKKIEAQIPDMLQDYADYLDGKIVPVDINEGIYRRKITETDYTIDINTDGINEIKNKIRSQNGYKGAVLKWKNKKYYINTYDEYLNIIQKNK